MRIEFLAELIGMATGFGGASSDWASCRWARQSSRNSGENCCASWPTGLKATLRIQPRDDIAKVIHNNPFGLVRNCFQDETMPLTPSLPIGWRGCVFVSFCQNGDKQLGEGQGMEQNVGAADRLNYGERQPSRKHSRGFGSFLPASLARAGHSRPRIAPLHRPGQLRRSLAGAQCDGRLASGQGYLSFEFGP